MVMMNACGGEEDNFGDVKEQPPIH